MGAHDDKWGHMRTHGERSHILLWPGRHPITLQKDQNVFSIFLNPSSSPSSWKQILPERLFLVQIQVALPVPLSYCCYQEIQFHCHHYFVIIIIVLSSSHHCITIIIIIIIVFPSSPLSLQQELLSLWSTTAVPAATFRDFHSAHATAHATATALSRHD